MSGEAPSTTKKGSVWEHYTKGKEIGRGNFSVVMLGLANEVRRFGVEKVAVKTCPRQDTQKVDVLRKEWMALSLAQHPNIILAYEYFEDATECSMVIEYAAEGTLMDWLNNHEITERQASKVIEQVLCAIEFLHENGYVHRDVKPHNILVAELQPLTIRLADFGLAKKCGDSWWARQCSAGDFEIMSPDMLGMMEDRQPATTEDYEKSDIYAVGVCLYFLLSGRAPYPAGVDPRKQADYPWLDASSVTFPGVSPTGVDVCKKLMAMDNSDRPEAKEALGQLEWFNMGRQQSSASAMGLSFTRIGSNAPSGNGGEGGTGGAQGPLHQGEGDEDDVPPVMLVRHQTDLAELDFSAQPSNEAVTFEGEVLREERNEQGCGGGEDPTLVAE